MVSGAEDLPVEEPEERTVLLPIEDRMFHPRANLIGRGCHQCWVLMTTPDDKTCSLFDMLDKQASQLDVQQPCSHCSSFHSHRQGRDRESCRDAR